MPALSRGVFVFVLFVSVSLVLSALPPMPLVAQESPPAIMIGAGDIATCDSNGDEQTAELIEKLLAKEIGDTTVFTLGDNVYTSGSAEQYRDCYEPTWGRFKQRTRPVAGNHDYVTADAAGYFGYFGGTAGDPTKGYYSYDIGSWHIIVLNSSLEMGSASPQAAWLRDDLKTHPTTCTLAMWHHPRFSSALHGNDDRFDTFWRILYDARADVILNGHDHDYERFAPQSPDAEPEPKRGIREFVVGTGGAPSYGFETIRANSEKRLTLLFGVIKLTLHPDSYDWEFIPVRDDLPSDSGHAECVK